MFDESGPGADNNLEDSLAARESKGGKLLPDTDNIGVKSCSYHK